MTMKCSQIWVKFRRHFGQQKKPAHVLTRCPPERGNENIRPIFHKLYPLLWSRRRPVVAIPGKGVRCQWGHFGMRALPYTLPNIDPLL